VGASVVVATAPVGAAPHVAALSDCQSSPSTGSYPPGSAQIGLQTSQEYPGQTNTVGGSGFATAGEPGAYGTVTLQICSTPESLGTVTLTANGTFSKAVTIPSSLAAGQHTVQATGPNGLGGTMILTTRLTLVSRTGATDVVTPTSSSLPFTGFDLIPVFAAALLLIVLGIALVVVARNRRPRPLA
jgi:titin